MMNPDLNIAGEKVGKWFENQVMDFCSLECISQFMQAAYITKVQGAS